MHKRGLSAVVATVILVALAVGLTVVVWTSVNNLILPKMEHAEACSNTFDQIEINKAYTCYNESAGETIFSITRKELEVDSLLVAVEYAGSSKLFELSEAPSNIDDLVLYPSRDASVYLPTAGGGRTYIILSSSGITFPTKIRIAPKIDGELCDTIDTISIIESCLLLG